MFGSFVDLCITLITELKFKGMVSTSPSETTSMILVFNASWFATIDSNY